MSLPRVCGLLAAAVAVLGSPVEGMAQSCAMCYTSAAASKGSGISALQHGILILLIPPLLVFAGICIAAFRRPNRLSGEDPLQEGEDLKVSSTRRTR